MKILEKFLAQAIDLLNYPSYLSVSPLCDLEIGMKEVALSTDDLMVNLYREGKTIREIKEQVPKFNQLYFYELLRKNKVPLRGKGSGLKVLWQKSRETGVTPTGKPFDPNKPRKAYKKKPKAVKAKVPSKEVALASETKIETVTPEVIESPGILILQTLLNTGAIKQSDIDFLVTPAIPAIEDKTKDKKSKSYVPRLPEEYAKVVKMWRNGMHNIDIVDILGISKSTVGRYIKHYRDSL